MLNVALEDERHPLVCSGCAICISFNYFIIQLFDYLIISSFNVFNLRHGPNLLRVHHLHWEIMGLEIRGHVAHVVHVASVSLANCLLPHALMLKLQIHSHIHSVIPSFIQRSDSGLRPRVCVYIYIHHAYKV